jgi:hypothetical protein
MMYNYILVNGAIHTFVETSVTAINYRHQALFICAQYCCCNDGIE